MTRRFALIPLVVALGFAAIVAGGAGADSGLIVPSTITAEATGPNGASVTWQVTDFDQNNNPVDITCGSHTGQGTLDVTDTYPLGDTTVSCTGGHGPGADHAQFHIIVQDTTAPTLSLPSSPVTASATSSNGANVAYSVSATDLVDPSPTVSCTPASGSQFPVGDTTVSCTATDHSNNTSSPPGTFTVRVTESPADTTPPVIANVPSDIAAEATSGSGAMVTYASPTATDDTDGSDPVTCAPASGSTFALGQTTVTCNASDQAGNAATPATFHVTVRDTTPPTLALPNSVTAPATSASGATVTFSATATDAVDGSLTPTCTPASGSVFPLNDTRVDCTVKDAHNNSASGHFTVTVTDKNAPVFSNVPGPLHVEAVGPNGATVTYQSPTATDPEDGVIPDVHCAPASGTVFPLGPTIVKCDASDSAGNPAHAEFTVTVVDTTPPTLNVANPTTVQAPSSDGISASASSVVAFLHAYIVSDLVDQSPTVTTNAPGFFPVGTTTVTFTARDASGNVTTKTSTLRVLAPPPPSSPPPPLPPPPVVTPPPPDVSSFRATAARGRITLSWTLPGSSAIDHVELLRAEATNGVAMTLVYKGTGKSFVDTRVQDGDTYRYQLVSVGMTGDRSTGVALTATPLSLRLLSPLPGKLLRAAPQLRWLPTAKASYYNLQLFRNGVKVMSTWPTASHFKLKAKWTYLGRKYKLSAATYKWYVWAGFGARAKQKYSPLLGQSAFTIGR